MELWQALLVGFGGNAALLLVISFLGRSLVGNFLTRDIERYKNLLTKEIEEFKADLQVAAIEHQIRFSKLHEKRAEVLATIYKFLVAATRETESFLSIFEFAGEPDKKAKSQEALRAITEYFRYFDQHRIYMPEELCASLEAFGHKLRSPTIRFGVYVNIENPNDTTTREKFDIWVKAWESVQNDVPKLRSALEGEFRKLLGGSKSQS